MTPVRPGIASCAARSLEDLAVDSGRIVPDPESTGQRAGLSDIDTGFLELHANVLAHISRGERIGALVVSAL